MSDKEHLEKHIQLHNSFDELLADFISHTGKRPSETSVMELMNWSYEQTINPKRYPQNT